MVLFFSNSTLHDISFGFCLRNVRWKLSSTIVYEEVIILPGIEWRCSKDANDAFDFTNSPYNLEGRIWEVKQPSMPGMDLIIEMWIENYDHVEYYDFIRNIVWSSSPMSPDCTVMVVYRPYNNFAFCRPGDKSWSSASGSRRYTQLAYSNKNKLFYARALVGGAIEAWDLREPSCPKRIHRLDHLRGYQPSNDEILEYLVESLGDILLVVRYIGLRTRLPSKTHRFDVFKLDFQQQRAERVECIGDRVLFLGPQQSFSVSALDFPELKPNSIYFPHYEREPEPGEQEPFMTWEPWEYDIGFYCLEDHSITRFTPLDMEDDHYQPGYWVIPKPPSDLY